MTRTPHPSSDSREPMSSQQKAVLAVLLVPTFASLLSVSSVNVLLAVIQDTLNASASDLQWVIAAYSLVFGVLLVAAGRAGAFVHMWVSPWDIAAASLICTELGVDFTRLDGTPLDLRWKGSVLVAPRRIHRELLQRLMIDAQ